MKGFIAGLWVFVCFGISGSAEAQVIRNLVLVTLDGVRPDEFFADGGARYFPRLQVRRMLHGVTLGDRSQNSPMKVSNESRMSLPGYQSIFVGHQTSCRTNECSAVNEATFLDRFVSEGVVSPEEVAVFSSWENIERALTVTRPHDPMRMRLNTGMREFSEPMSDSIIQQINHDQSANPPPWHHARYDQYTWQMAMRYLQLAQPRIFYLSFDDSDERAHRGEWRKYENSLRQYDVWLEELQQFLDNSEQYRDSTLFIVTTDHGRGQGEAWRHHGVLFPRSKWIWMYMNWPAAQMEGLGAQNSSRTFRHADIRPTIESAFGLAPIQCDGCGSAIPLN